MKKKKDGLLHRLFRRRSGERTHEMPQVLYGPPPVPQPPVAKPDDKAPQILYGPPPIDRGRRDI